jgi:hypothetical protein
MSTGLSQRCADVYQASRMRHRRHTRSDCTNQTEQQQHTHNHTTREETHTHLESTRKSSSAETDTIHTDEEKDA